MLHASLCLYSMSQVQHVFYVKPYRLELSTASMIVANC